MGSERGRIVGLTGSIASGKSYILQLFAEHGVPTQSSDAVAHELLDGEAFDEVAAEFPGAVAGGKINRQKLGAEVFADAERKKKLEAIIHPLVRARNIEFAENAGADFVVIEIPLLYESGAEEYCDFVIAINVSRETIEKRALSLKGMTPEKLAQILATQIPTQEKLELAEFVIDNDHGDDTVGQVREIIARIGKKL